MKKLFFTKSILLLAVVISVPFNPCIASGQTEKEKATPIPVNVNKIFLTSCWKCHGDKGGRLPHSKINFSKWSGYSAAKEAEKASMICSALKNGSMPPKAQRKAHPELVPSKDETDLICSWAETLNAKKKKR